MATESLIIEIDAKTNKLDAALKSTDKKLEALDNNVKSTDKSFSKLSGSAGVVGSALGKTATAGLALATALTAVILKSASSQQELNILSSQAKLSADEFEALAFAAKQYGIDAKGVGDISKDIADRLGEFGKVGTGPFQDFADIVGITKNEAQKLALEFESMSSDQVLGEMVKKMEQAGATSNQMTFVFESMSGEMSRLLPLFTNGAKELDGLRGAFKSATEQLKLSTGEIKALQGAATTFDLMTDSLGKAGTLISAQAAPVLSEFFTSVIEEVPTATQTIVNFINSFKDAKNIENLTSIQSELKEKTTDLNIAALELANTEAKLAEAQDPRQRSAYTRMVAEQRVEVEELTSRIDGLTEQEKKLTEQRIADAETLESKGISAGAGQGGGGGGTGDQVQAIADRFKSEEDLLREKLERELEITKGNGELQNELREEHLLRLLEMDENNEQQRLDIKEAAQKKADKILKKDQDSEKKSFNDKLSIASSYASAASSINSALFEDNKLISAGVIVADTAVAISKANALGPPQSIPAMAAAAAAGAAQLAALKSASKGGGGVAAPAAIAPVATEPEPTTQIAVSDTDSSGRGSSQVLSIRIDSDDSELAVALNGILGKAKVDGVIS